MLVMIGPKANISNTITIINAGSILSILATAKILFFYF